MNTMNNAIQSLKIKGLRGFKEDFSLELKDRSILIYGENGSGKSSIVDALEWFYYNRVEHLSQEEIGRGGLDALRHFQLEPDEAGTLALEFSDTTVNSAKEIFYKKDSLKSLYSNSTDEFNRYLEDSQKENLVLRHKDLLTFIQGSKKEKMDQLAKIIGFSELTSIRDTLRKTISELKKELKTGDFDNRINRQQSIIIDHLDRSVNSESQLVEAVNELIQPLNLNHPITGLDQLDDLLSLINKPEDPGLIERRSYYQRVSDWALSLPQALDEIEEMYRSYSSLYQKIAKDIEKINKILLEHLYSEGVRVLSENIVEGDLCPLCLQTKNKNQLLAELETRLGELAQSKKEKHELDSLKESLKKSLRQIQYKMAPFQSEDPFKEKEEPVVNNGFRFTNETVQRYLEQMEVDLASFKSPESPETLLLDRSVLQKINVTCVQNIDHLKASQNRDMRSEIYEKLVLSRQAFFQIQQFKHKKEILERQQASMEAVYNQFLDTQKDAFQSFLDQFSGEINQLYQYMNPEENVDEIRLIPLEKDDVLQGITLEYSFHSKKTSPPQKYLSESHLNCLGLVFFLASVKAFNKRNRFFILDDVISSFDTTHRERFGQLLKNKFQDYQVIVLSHEKEWFHRMQNKASGKNWIFKILPDMLE